MWIHLIFSSHIWVMVKKQGAISLDKAGLANVKMFFPLMQKKETSWVKVVKAQLSSLLQVIASGISTGLIFFFFFTTTHFPPLLVEVLLKLNLKNHTFIQSQHVHNELWCPSYTELPVRWLRDTVLSSGSRLLKNWCALRKGRHSELAFVSCILSEVLLCLFFFLCVIHLSICLHGCLHFFVSLWIEDCQGPP